MGKALQVVSGFVTAPTGLPTFDQVTNAGQDTFATNNYNPGAEAAIIDAWADIDGTNAGEIRLRSPNFHDDVNGINMWVPAVSPTPVMPGSARQRLFSNDVITAELGDDGTGNPSGLTLLTYYSDLPGANARLYRWAEIVGAIEDLMGCQVDVAPGGGTAGDYDGAVVINALQDQFKASTDYALLGWTTSVQYQTVGITGPDTSNRRVGGPGTTPDVMDVREWFVDVSNKSGYPCIPVFNSQNMNATVVDVIDTEAVGNGSVTFLFARLRRGSLGVT
jgi:hypothetical protein